LREEEGASFFHLNSFTKQQTYTIFSQYPQDQYNVVAKNTKKGKTAKLK